MFGSSKIPTLKLPKAPPGADGRKAAPDDKPAETPVSPSSTAPVKPGTPANSAMPRASDRSDEFYELKTRIHRKLVETLDLAALSKRTDDVKEEVRAVIAQLCEQQNALLNLSERQRLVGEILDETFGLGPLETLLKDPHISGCTSSARVVCNCRT
jgi:hypothetical protein